MIWLAAVMIARTRAGAPVGTAARPFRRIIAVFPATVGVFETGSAGIDDQGLPGCGLLPCGEVGPCGVPGVSGGSPWNGDQPLPSDGAGLSHGWLCGVGDWPFGSCQ